MKAWPSKTQEKPPRVCDITHLLCSADNPPTSVWSIREANIFSSLQRGGGKEKCLPARGPGPVWQEQGSFCTAHMEKGSLPPGLSLPGHLASLPVSRHPACGKVVHDPRPGNPQHGVSQTVVLEPPASESSGEPVKDAGFWPGPKMYWIINLGSGTQIPSLNRLYLCTLGFDSHCLEPWDSLLCRLQGA